MARLGKKISTKTKIKLAASEFKSSFKSNSKLLPPSASSKIVKFANTAGKIARIGSRLLGGAGVGLSLVDMYKSGQKRSGGKVKRNQKTNTMGFGKKSIFKKK